MIQSSNGLRLQFEPRPPFLVLRQFPGRAIHHARIRTSAGVDRIVYPVHHHPVRVELVPGCHVAYNAAPDPKADLTLRPDVDTHNFSIIRAGQLVAWLGPRGLAGLRVHGEDQRDRAAEFFDAMGHELRAKADFRPLMVTTNAAIAESDCLFYAVLLDEERRG